jgi:molybdate transport system substrate-binding protein
MQFRRTGTAGTGGASALASPNSDGPLNTFAAAITTNASNLEGAKKLIEYLSSPIAVEPIKNSGMNVIQSK